MLALPALAFTEGANILWLVGFLAVGVWLNWTLIARRLRRYTIAAEDSLTVPEFFERRFADGTGALRTVAGVLTIFFIVFYTNSGLIAGADLMGSVFAIDLAPGIWITLFAVTSYTFIGGFLAVSRTDVFQAVLMLAGFIIMPITLLVVADDPFHEVGETRPGSSTPSPTPPARWSRRCSSSAWQAGASAPSARSASCSASWRWRARRRATRAATSRSPGVASGILTVAYPDSILNLVAYAWGGMGATFGPVVVLSLYWRRFNTAGAMAGMLVGFAVSTLWQFGLEGGPQGVFDIMPATPGCVARTIAAVVATLRTAPPSEDVVRTFDAVVGRATARP